MAEPGAASHSLWGIYFLLTLPGGLEAWLTRLLLGMLCISVALLLGIAAGSRLRFTERGVFSPSGYIAWEDVGAYRWGAAGGPTLTLIPRRALPFFASMPWAIPPGQKEVLAQRAVPESATGR